MPALLRKSQPKLSGSPRLPWGRSSRAGENQRWLFAPLESRPIKDGKMSQEKELK